MSAKPTKTKRTRVNVTLTPELHRVGKKLAQEDNRKFSNLMEHLIVAESKRRKAA